MLADRDAPLWMKNSRSSFTSGSRISDGCVSLERASAKVEARPVGNPVGASTLPSHSKGIFYLLEVGLPKSNLACANLNLIGQVGKATAPPKE
jgi:hypothetical protein